MPGPAVRPDQADHRPVSVSKTEPAILAPARSSGSLALARRGRVGRSLGPLPGRQRIPHADGEVTGSGDEPGTVRAPGDGVDVVGIAAQLGDLLAAGDVEQADSAVAAAGGQPRAVGAERHAVDNTP